MNTSQQRAQGADRSTARRAELIAIGRKLFADTSYDALSMDDIAQHACVAKGLIYYYFKSKRGYYLAIIEESVGELVDGASSVGDLAPVERVHRTVDGYLRYAESNQAAYRTIVTGGVGFDAQVQAIRDEVRDALIDTIARAAYGTSQVPLLARTALLGWLCSVEGITLDWIGHHALERDTVRSLLVRTLGETLRVIEEFEPSHPAPVLP
ncbi:TetR/AcrR family transcriptional regulator [Streptomyces sp. NPDC001661]